MTDPIAEDDHGRRYLLPHFVESRSGFHGYKCAKDWCEETPGFFCGCPVCLLGHGKTLVYNAEDFTPDGHSIDWGRHVVDEKLAIMVQERICPYYPGATIEGK